MGDHLLEGCAGLGSKLDSEPGSASPRESGFDLPRLVPPKRPHIPGRPGHPIDALIRETFRPGPLRPSPKADRPTLLHLQGIDHARFSFLLHGLEMSMTGVEEARVGKDLLA